MEKLLYILNVTDGVNSFSLSSILAAQRMGLEFHMAGDFSQNTREKLDEDEKKYGIRIHQIDLSRSPFSLKNITAYRQLIELINKEKFDYIHCNTPVGGVLGRLAGMNGRIKRVIYQAHGFHFYKGAPIINWMLYCPVEILLARVTDAVITINREDYQFALKHMHPRSCVYYVPGVGMDLAKYKLPENIREIKRNELGLKDTDIALISMGDLIERKNYSVAIESVSKSNIPGLHYYICGKGPEEHRLKALAEKLGVKDIIHFLGYRTDIKELLRAADIFLLTSKQEGLARSLMEAMASGLPCIASRIRGNTDLIEGTSCGYLCADIEEFVSAIQTISASNNRGKFSDACIKRIKSFNLESVIDSMRIVYRNELR